MDFATPIYTPLGIPFIDCRVLGCRSLFGGGDGGVFDSQFHRLWQTDFATPVYISLWQTDFATPIYHRLWQTDFATPTRHLEPQNESAPNIITALYCSKGYIERAGNAKGGSKQFLCGKVYVLQIFRRYRSLFWWPTKPASESENEGLLRCCSASLSRTDLISYG